MDRPIDRSALATLLALFLVTLFCWDSTFIYPFKVFVVFLHELSHGCAAVLSGGEIVRIELSPQLGGVCWTRGGWPLFVLPAGYLGSMFLGGLIVVAASRTRYDQAIATGIGVAVLVITLKYVDTLFGVVFGLLFGAGMVGAGKVLSEGANDLLLKFIGLTSVLYAIIDIKEDLISRTVAGSDAFQMSRQFGLPPVFWGVLWILVAVSVAGALLNEASRGSRSEPHSSLR